MGDYSGKKKEKRKIIMCDLKKTKSYFQGLFIGGLLAAGATFLFGTEKGKKIRKTWDKKGRNFLEELLNLIEEIEEKGEKAIGKAEEVKEEISEKVQTAKKTPSQIVQDIQKRGRRFFKNLPKK